MEKNLDFLLRPRDDMWWLRKERLLVVKMQDRTAQRGREREGRESVVKSETEPTPRHPDEGGKKKQKTPNRKRARDKRKKKHNQR